ncbi:Gfo/Idh/MocA family protein [Dyadobacter subterraneus]|uniref:Gfo/Idh/MocA family oxidoreductase n=1 Tax=Dyadobacter subterraneus TaxID=2773304 RepID=A0ABR9WBF6_9BACT|nr:Gfo/Idh/MocA family oxidoreductase [Dyadobacter subterraneus]MBE9462316.1 Gfo/Idh/MocA family oxidoreductase [Dyadobacter subterraneus]
MDTKIITPFSRRNFLAAGAGIITASIFSPFSIALGKPKERLGIALVGLGYYSTDLLAPALQKTKNCYLAGIVTGTPDKAETWKKKYNIPDKNIYNYKNFDSIANNPDIDVVYIVLPPSMHKEFVIRAAKAGKHVFCEKPMALNVQECEEMIKVCKDNKRSLSIGYRCQHDPNTQEYMRIAKEKALGNVQLISCAAGYKESRADNWKVKKSMGGGAMYDMGVYALQGARLAAGAEPISVTAEIVINRPEIFKDADEITHFQLQFPGGTVANCTGSHGISTNFLKVNYDKGTLYMDSFSAYTGNKGYSTLGEINFPVDNQQAKQMDEDALAIMQSKPVLVPGEEGMRDIRIVQAIYQAAQTGKSVKIG